MSKEILKCRCKADYKCSAPIHGEIVITNCEKNCGLGCAELVRRSKKK